MDEKERSLLTALSRRLVQLLNQENDPADAMQNLASQMSNLGLLEAEPETSNPQAFAEEVTLSNPVMMSKANFLREHQIKASEIESLTDWLEKIA